MAKKIAIEVGHAGIGLDPGAIGNGEKGQVIESDCNLHIALELKRQLERHGVEVLMSRTTSQGQYVMSGAVKSHVSWFIPKVTLFNPDIGISVHSNAGGGIGFECYKQIEGLSVASINRAKNSASLCDKIETQVKSVGQKSRGVKPKPTNNLGIMDLPFVWCYTEGFFVDNVTDSKNWDELVEQQKLGVAYAKGLLDYLGIAWKSETPAPSTSTATVYRVYKQDSAYKEKSNADAQANKIGGIVIAG